MGLLFGWLAVFLGAVSIASPRAIATKAPTPSSMAISARVRRHRPVCLHLRRGGCATVVHASLRGRRRHWRHCRRGSGGHLHQQPWGDCCRGDTTQAERRKAKTDSAADLADLKRIARERDGMVFVPMTAEVVQAARDAVKSAEEIRQRECGGGDLRQRGPNCRQRETEEQTKRDAWRPSSPTWL